jgi:large subunit ribosomal protein L21
MSVAYAIIQLGGKQYRVQEGETLTVDLVNGDEKLTVSEGLLLKTDSEVKIGQPYVAGASVQLERVADTLGEKLEIYKYKAKSRYRRHTGHRQSQSVLRVQKITA